METITEKEIFGLKISEIQDLITEIGFKILIAVIIVVVGFWLAKKVTRIIKKVMKARQLDQGLISFITSIFNIGFKIMVLITAASQLGIEMTSFFALLGAAGLAIGMAFSGTLSNLAGGVVVLVLRPFKAGDFIEAQGETGTVEEVQIFHTLLVTPNNKYIYLPNGQLANNNITNYTKKEIRRIDWEYGIGYGDDYKKAVVLLKKFIQEDTRILQDPEPFIGLVTLADSSVNLAVRAWSKNEDYWNVFFKMNERVYEEFTDEGLNIPFPQMDVHLIKE